MKRLKILGLMTAMAVILGACSDAPTAKRILESAGYTDVSTSGYAFFACSQDDSFATGFTATAPGGQRISGAVCSGWLKGGTIRLY